MSSDAPRDLAVEALREPRSVATLSLTQWSLLIRQARQAGVLARIAVSCDQAGLTERLPAQAQAHLTAARTLASAQHFEMTREVRFIQQALAPLGLPVVLLKGAAYLLHGLDATRGRAFSDVDILVPKTRIHDVEAALMLQGWITTHHSAYDQRYYREWMHELPPMEHLRRQSVLDVHHTILPETARLRPDPAKLLADTQPVAGVPGVMSLAPVDMVLHSMTHLFHNDDLSHGLRDVSDLDLLLRQFACDDFWRRLGVRSREMDLARPLHYGLRCTHRILGTPVPEAALADAAAAAPAAPAARLMDALWWRALRSQHSTAAPRFTATALFLLYVRAHWLRMPPLLLMRHLTVKALRLNEEDPKLA